METGALTVWIGLLCDFMADTVLLSASEICCNFIKYRPYFKYSNPRLGLGKIKNITLQNEIGTVQIISGHHHTFQAYIFGKCSASLSRNVCKDGNTDRFNRLCL